MAHKALMAHTSPRQSAMVETLMAHKALKADTSPRQSAMVETPYGA
jgi:hypothetical protein